MRKLCGRHLSLVPPESTKGTGLGIPDQLSHQDRKKCWATVMGARTQVQEAKSLILTLCPGFSVSLNEDGCPSELQFPPLKRGAAKLTKLCHQHSLGWWLLSLSAQRRAQKTVLDKRSQEQVYIQGGKKNWGFPVVGWSGLAPPVQGADLIPGQELRSHGSWPHINTLKKTTHTEAIL